MPISLGEVFRPYVSEAQMPTAQNVVPIPSPVPAHPQASMTYDRNLASAPKTIEVVKISFPRGLFLISIN